MMLRSLACLLFVLLSSTALQAQFSSTIKVLKRGHIVGEPVIVRVTLTNYTGKEQVLQGNRMPWISFMVQTSNGNPIIARNVAGPKPVRIGPGQSMARDFNLSQQFQLNEVGNYSVSAVIRPQNDKLEGTTTNRAHFELSNGRPHWSQKVGDVGPTGGTREFRLLKFRSDKGTQLFVQIMNVDTGQISRTVALGEALMIRNPTAIVDGDRHLNVLFLATPTTYLHYRITPEGKIVTRDMHKRAAQGDPKLATMNRGIVIVANSIYFNPEAEARERAKIRKITDRP